MRMKHVADRLGVRYSGAKKEPCLTVAGAADHLIYDAVVVVGVVYRGLQLVFDVLAAALADALGREHRPRQLRP